MEHLEGVPLIIYYSSGVDQIVVPQGGGFHKLRIVELHVILLAGHLCFWKLTHSSKGSGSLNYVGQ